MREHMYMVAYELLEPEREDAAIVRLLSSYRGKKQKLLHNAWLVKTSEEAEELYAKLNPLLGANDRCVVMLVSRSCWAARLPRILQKVTLWMAM